MGSDRKLMEVQSVQSWTSARPFLIKQGLYLIIERAQLGSGLNLQIRETEAPKQSQKILTMTKSQNFFP